MLIGLVPILLMLSQPLASFSYLEDQSPGLVSISIQSPYPPLRLNMLPNLLPFRKLSSLSLFWEDSISSPQSPWEFLLIIRVPLLYLRTQNSTLVLNISTSGTTDISFWGHFTVTMRDFAEWLHRLQCPYMAWPFNFQKALVDVTSNCVTPIKYLGIPLFRKAHQNLILGSKSKAVNYIPSLCLTTGFSHDDISPCQLIPTRSL